MSRGARAAISVLCWLVWSATDVHADEPPMPRLSLTFSPAYLIVPMGEVTAEWRARDRLGLAAMAGAGRVARSAPGIETHVMLYELGVQARYYLLGDFRRGVLLAAQGDYFHLHDPFQHQLALSGDALALGSFVGWKLTMATGFTIEAGGGYQHLWARGVQNGETFTTGTSALLLHANVGWSF